MIASKILQMQTVMVTLTKEDEDGQGTYCHAHGMKFPELKWELI